MKQAVALRIVQHNLLEINNLLIYFRYNGNAIYLVISIVHVDI